MPQAEIVERPGYTYSVMQGPSPEPISQLTQAHLQRVANWFNEGEANVELTQSFNLVFPILSRPGISIKDDPADFNSIEDYHASRISKAKARLKAFKQAAEENFHEVNDPSYTF